MLWAEEKGLVGEREPDQHLQGGSKRVNLVERTCRQLYKLIVGGHELWKRYKDVKNGELKHVWSWVKQDHDAFQKLVKGLRCYNKDLKELSRPPPMPIPDSFVPNTARAGDKKTAKKAVMTVDDEDDDLHETCIQDDAKGQEQDQSDDDHTPLQPYNPSPRRRRRRRISEDSVQKVMPDLQDIFAGARSQDPPDLFSSNFVSRSRGQHERKRDMAKKIAVNTAMTALVVGHVAAFATCCLALSTMVAPVTLAMKGWELVRGEEDDYD